MEGTLQDVGLLKVLPSVAAQRSSGILSVQSDEDIVAVSFLRGAIVAADSLSQTQEESLGAALDEQGLISPADYAAVVEEHQNSDNNLIEMLVDRGLLSRGEILDSLRATTYKLMLQLLSWKSGDFKFYGGDEVSYEDGFKPLTVEELLIRSVDDLPVGSGLSGPVPELEAIFRALPPRSEVQVYGRDGDGLGGGVWISAEQADLLQNIDGKTQALSLTRTLRLGRQQAQFHLLRLLSFDLIQMASPGTAAATAQTAGRSSVGKTSGAMPVVQAPAPSLDRVLPEPSKAHLMAEIFQPPEPSDAVPAPPVAETPTVHPISLWLQKGAGPALAALFLICIGLALSQRPGTILLPFPWQENQRGTVERQLRYSLFLKIDRATHAYAMSTGAYPETLQELVDTGLLAAADLKDPAGYELSYKGELESYRIDLLDDGEVVDGLGTSTAVTGDFLLDSRMLDSEGDSENPLVLLSN